MTQITISADRVHPLAREALIVVGLAGLTALASFRVRPSGPDGAR